MHKLLRRWVLPYILWLIYRLLVWTWRIQIFEPDSFKKTLAQDEPFVAAHWHGDELVLISLIRRYRIATMTSTSQDGELMDTIIKLQGGVTSRGSSTRGGVSALRGIFNLIRSGYHPSVAVDGPKGPIHKVKPGVFEISRITQAPIFPIAVFAPQAFVFKKSWNQTFLPKPFSAVFVKWGEPLSAVSRAADPRAPNLASELEAALNAAKQRSPAP